MQKLIYTIVITYRKRCENLKFVKIIYTDNVAKGFCSKVCKGFYIFKNYKASFSL